MEPEIPATPPAIPQVPEVSVIRRPNPIFMNDRGLRAGWRLLIYFAMIGTPILILRLLAKLASGGAPATPRTMPQIPEVLMTAIQGGAELALFLLLLLFAWIMSKIEHRKVGAYGLPLQKSLFPSFGTGYVLWGFLPLAFLLLILHAVHVFYFGGFSQLNGQIFGWGLLWWAFFLLVGFFEEFCFRGYFLYTLADGIGFWPAAIIQAILFAFVHMGNGGETKIGIVATAFFALFAAATVWRTGNLWLAVGAHAGWDWGQSYFFGVNDSGLKVSGHLLNPTITGPDWLSGGSVGPEGSAVALILWALMFLVVVLFLKKRPQPALEIVEAPKY
jgi:hypothetical protein